MATTDAVSGPLCPEWDEAQYAAAIEHIEQVRQQIWEIRHNVPDMLRSFATDHDTPQQMYAEFERFAYRSVKGTRELRATWESEATQNILDKVYDLETANTGNSSVGVSKWVEQTKKAEDEKNGRDPWDNDWPIYSSMEPLKESPYMSEGDYTKEDEVKPIVEEYQKEHPKLKVGFDEEHRVVMVHIPVFSGLDFTIEASDKDPHHFKVSCKGNTTLCRAITRSIRMHPLQNDLEYILDLIASYVNLQTSACASCKTVIDSDSALPPVTRRLHVDKTADGKKKTTWITLHNTCHKYRD